MMTTTGESPWYLAPLALSLQASGRDDAIRQVTGLWAGHVTLAGVLPALGSAILARENLRSTALPNGIALPHARTPVLEDPVLAIGKLVEPVDFAGTAVWMVIAIASPASHPDKHLGMLNRLSKLLSSGGVLTTLRSATTPEEIRALPFPF